MKLFLFFLIYSGLLYSSNKRNDLLAQLSVTTYITSSMNIVSNNYQEIVLDPMKVIAAFKEQNIKNGFVSVPYGERKNSYVSDADSEI
jgi:hypothetical protein